MQNGEYQRGLGDSGSGGVPSCSPLQREPPRNFQHPDVANQAYFPKAAVVFGLSIAAISILMLPADVANKQACRHTTYNGASHLTLPMKDLWLAVYIGNAVLIFFVIPFSMFYYEGDQDKSVGKRIKSALMWVATSFVVCALVVGILYGPFAYIPTILHLNYTCQIKPNCGTTKRVDHAGYHSYMLENPHIDEGRDRDLIAFSM